MPSDSGALGPGLVGFGGSPALGSNGNMYHQQILLDYKGLIGVIIIYKNQIKLSVTIFNLFMK